MAGDASTWSGTWLLWSALGVVVAALVPGACFLFVAPALVAGLTGGLRREDLRVATPSVAAAVVWLPLVILVYQGLGLRVAVAAALPSIMLVSTWPPLARPRVLAAPAAIALVAFVVALLVPPFSEDVPERVNVVYRQDAHGARVYVAANWGPFRSGEPPLEMVRALGDHPTRGTPFPTWPSAPGVEVPSVFTPERRGAKTLVLVSDAPTVTIDDRPATLAGGMLVVRNVPREGLRITLPPGRTAKMLAVTPGVPAGLAREVQNARPASAVASQDGDITVVETDF